MDGVEKKKKHARTKFAHCAKFTRCANSSCNLIMKYLRCSIVITAAHVCYKLKWQLASEISFAIIDWLTFSDMQNSSASLACDVAPLASAIWINLQPMIRRQLSLVQLTDTVSQQWYPSCSCYIHCISTDLDWCSFIYCAWHTWEVNGFICLIYYRIFTRKCNKVSRRKAGLNRAFDIHYWYTARIKWSN